MVLKNSFILASICALLVACKDTPSKEEANLIKQTPAQQAASLYSMHCAQCHGEDGKLGASGAKDLTKSKLTDAQIIRILQEGKGAMPPMQGLLETSANMNLVRDHIKGLRR